MAVTNNTLATGEVIPTASGAPDFSKGSVGLDTQLPGNPATASALAEANGGIAAGNFVTPDLDEELYRFNSDDTPLMNLMLKAKTVKVESPVVEHFMIDEPKASVTVSANMSASTSTAVLKLAAKDQEIVRPYMTLLVKGVNGYDPTGQTATPGKDLMLFVTGRDATSNNPIVRSVNGPKTNATDEYGNVPAINAGTTIVILSNALYETQKEVDPDIASPQVTQVYLQKRGMNQVVSDYFDSQKKRIPFTKALLAEQAIQSFKTRCNRSLWAGRKGKFKVNIPKLGVQDVYFSEGLRWQFKRELQHTGKWTIEELIALAKMYFTGEDVPKTALALCGKNFLENIQCIDFTTHPEIQVTQKTNPMGWVVTNIHTVFGDIEFKREPTLDYLGWSNSAALIGENRLVHYVRTNEHSFEDKIEGEEATRSGILKWDALALKGSCHIWIDGDSTSANTSVVNIVLWDSASAPTGDDLVSGRVYYLLQDCSGINAAANAGEMWQATITGTGGDAVTTWAEFKGEYYA